MGVRVLWFQPELGIIFGRPFFRPSHGFARAGGPELGLTITSGVDCTDGTDGSRLEACRRFSTWNLDAFGDKE